MDRLILIISEVRHGQFFSLGLMGTGQMILMMHGLNHHVEVLEP